MQYPKVNSLFIRHPITKSLVLDEYSLPEFANIKYWDVEEKIDGTNIRVIFKDGTVKFGGRTKDAMIPGHLLSYLQNHFTIDLMKDVFPLKQNGQWPHVILFGEGFGPKIQAGGYYCKEASFCFFDAWIEGWWLEKNSIRDILSWDLNVYTPPILITKGEIPEIIELVKQKPHSFFAMNDPENEHTMEGVMCRPFSLLLQRNGNPLIFKLKCQDFPSD